MMLILQLLLFLPIISANICYKNLDDIGCFDMNNFNSSYYVKKNTISDIYTCHDYYLSLGSDCYFAFLDNKCYCILQTEINEKKAEKVNDDLCKNSNSKSYSNIYYSKILCPFVIDQCSKYEKCEIQINCCDYHISFFDTFLIMKNTYIISFIILFLILFLSCIVSKFRKRRRLYNNFNNITNSIIYLEDGRELSNTVVDYTQIKKNIIDNIEIIQNNENNDNIDNIENIEDDNCSICCESLKNKSRFQIMSIQLCRLRCSHIYHYNCVINFVDYCIQNKKIPVLCPLCRQQLYL
jgi:cbb3-type cytochrome oxidase subunit 3